MSDKRKKIGIYVISTTTACFFTELLQLLLLMFCDKKNVNSFFWEKKLIIVVKYDSFTVENRTKWNDKQGPTKLKSLALNITLIRHIEPVTLVQN